ncbi:hypothetical protein ABIC94_004876 [Variovorax paradoxus]|jgi:hypothetical protein
MRSTAFVLLFCIGLVTAGCDDRPKPGGPMPKASVNVVVPALSAG